MNYTQHLLLHPDSIHKGPEENNEDIEDVKHDSGLFTDAEENKTDKSLDN